MGQEQISSKEEAIAFLNSLYGVVEDVRLTKKEHVQLDGMYVGLKKFINDTSEVEPEAKGRQ